MAVYFIHMSETLWSPLYMTLAIFGLILAITLPAIPAEAADGLPDGCHIATAAEVAAGAPAGFPICPFDTAAGINDEVGQAKQYLMSVPKQDLSGCAPPSDPQNIIRLKPAFALCSARFIKAYSSTIGGIVITSAFRDGAPGSSLKGDGASANQCAGGAVQSNHQDGIAMDVRPENGNFEQLWNFASQNPQFGVCFPYRGGDRPHMTLAGTGTGEAAKCAAQGVAASCDGSNFDPNSIRVAGNTPVSDLIDRLRQTFGSDLSQQSESEPMCRLSDGWEVPCSSIANKGGTPPGQTTSPGGAGIPTQALPASQQPTQYLPTPKPVSNLVHSETERIPSSGTTTVLSAYERIRIFAGTRTPTSTSTSTPFTLFVRGEDAGRIGNQSAAQVTPVQDNAYKLTPPTSQNTFTSNDLSGGTSVVASQGTTGYQKILEEMKSSLLRALEYLRPFGRPTFDLEHRDGYY